MRKLIVFLTSLALISSSASNVLACQSEMIVNGCFDEDGKNRTDKDSDIGQWIDIDYIRLFFFYLSNEIFPDSSSFQKMNHVNSDEMRKNYLRGPEGQLIEFEFNNQFTFLITNYSSIDKDVIAEMKENELSEKNPGVYLFLNLPEINITDIKKEESLIFQFLFVIKDPDGTIRGNHNNNWFYWCDWKTTNINPSKYFFNLEIGTTYQRVVTKYFN